MTPFLAGLAVLVLLAVGVLLLLRRREERRVREVARTLVSGGLDERFDPRMVEDLPKAARRYLLHVLEPGAPPASSVRLTLPGSIRMSRQGDPLPLQSEEILAAGRGYVWTARMTMGPVTIRGFDAYADGEGEMRWWLAGLVPVVRKEGEDVSRSAAGRLAGGLALFLPSTLLPSRAAEWQTVDESTARARISAGGESFELTLEVNPDGSMRRLRFPRWNSDPDIGPVGTLSFVSDRFGEESTFDGHTLPTRFRAGWRLGEEDEFPFFFVRGAEAVYRQHERPPSPT